MLHIMLVKFWAYKGKNMTIISPSILSADFANLENDIRRVENAGADWLHIDVMDGHFVPNITIGVPVVASIKKVTRLPLDVHLMIENPEKYIEPFAKAGADIITFHYEAAVKEDRKTGRQEDKPVCKIIRLIKSFGLKAGMSIKPKTPADVVFPYLNDLDMVLIMTVEPGFGGQKFMPDCAEKIKVIKNYIEKPTTASGPPPLNKGGNDGLIIQVDGGINAETARICTSYGANSLVAGNYIYKSNDIEFSIQSLR